MPLAKVIQLRPAAARPGVRAGRSRRPGPRRILVPPRPIVSPVRVDWDEPRGLYVAVCERCCDTFAAELLDNAHTWAEDHRCDPELAVLLAEILGGAA